MISPYGDWWEASAGEARMVVVPKGAVKDLDKGTITQELYAECDGPEQTALEELEQSYGGGN